MTSQTIDRNATKHRPIVPQIIDQEIIDRLFAAIVVGAGCAPPRAI
jgi:hypothetical protein